MKHIACPNDVGFLQPGHKTFTFKIDVVLQQIANTKIRCIHAPRSAVAHADSTFDLTEEAGTKDALLFVGQQGDVAREGFR